MVKSKVLKVLVITVVLVVVSVFMFVPSHIDKDMNRQHSSDLPAISTHAKTLHAQLFIGDWHSDSLMWSRDFSAENAHGHVDIPRLQQGNVALQMFTTVTKSPSALNYDNNHADANDNITKLALVNRWPIDTWSSLTARAMHQAGKLAGLIANHPEQIVLIDSKLALSKFLIQRSSNLKLIGSLLGTEGSHALDGDINNIQNLYDVGFRMMSLHHFFDNKLGGSLHGVSGNGLTEFGQQVVKKIQSMDIILDVSHSSEKAVHQVLKMSTKPLVVSHTGFYGHCPSARNISDELMIRIANQGGLIAVGYWDGAVCEPTVTEIAKAIKYGVELVGSQHIALGSDFDGATSVPFDAANMIYLTQALLDIGLTEQQIRDVMGDNMLQFLASQLPD